MRSKEGLITANLTYSALTLLCEHFVIFMKAQFSSQLVTTISHFQENGHQKHFENGVLFSPILADTPVEQECRETIGHKTTVYVSTFCYRM